MPLFAFIFGLMFSASVVSVEDVIRKLAGKAHRLLVPLLTVGTIFFVIQAELHHTPLSDVCRVYFTDYEKFWYLAATFTVMTATLIVAFLLPHSHLIAVAVCLIVSAG